MIPDERNIHACQHCGSGRGTCLLRDSNKMNNQIIEKESAEFCVVLAVQKGLRLGSRYIVAWAKTIGFPSCNAE